MRNEPDPTNSPPPSPPRWGGLGGERAICVANTNAKDRDDAFERFWTLYPRKVGKLAARKAWQRLNPDRQTIERMMLALEWQKESDQWQQERGRFIPHPTTWLNQGRWEDEPIVKLTFSQRVQELARSLVERGLASE